jgi:hypothetical protein
MSGSKEKFLGDLDEGGENHNSEFRIKNSELNKNNILFNFEI